MKKIKVLIVDDHTLVRQGLRALLGLTADIEIVGEASDGREAIEKVRQLGPDIVLMDLAMEEMGGLEATRRIRQDFPSTRVLAVTQYDDSEYVIPVIEAGASGYLTKVSSPLELTSAIQTVYRGESYLSPSAATALVEVCQTKPDLEGEKDSYQLLTDREKETLKLLAEGHTTREIAETLFISPKTVEWYKTNLMSKLKIRNTVGLIKYAIRKRIITL